MQRNLWMRPALQKSEAVLLPALPNRFTAGSHYLQQAVHVTASESSFRPVEVQQEQGQPLALSTYVRPRGSMAGRSVLRAAGLTGDPFGRRNRPRYYSPASRTMPQQSRWHTFR